MRRRCPPPPPLRMPVTNPDTNETNCELLCPDMMLFSHYREWYPIYVEMSFWINGITILSLVIVGCIGNGLLLYSIRSNRGQYRLCWHVRLLCFWDTLALLSMLGLSAMPSLWHKTAEVYGSSSYLIRVFFPISNMAYLGSMWQILAICTERFLAVTYPLKQYASSKKSLRFICICIAIGAIIVYGPIVFESQMETCYHPRQRKWYPLLQAKDFTQYEAYKWILHRIPSFLLRSPTPFALSVFLTAGTLQGRHGRMRLSINSHRHSSGVRRKGCTTAVTLTIINIKFIVLQSLPVAYDIMNIFKTLSQRHQFYLADISNVLLTLQSATNWLVFIQWRDESGSNKPKKAQTEMFTPAELERLKHMYTNNLEGHTAELAKGIRDALRATDPMSPSDSERTIVTVVDEISDDIEPQKLSEAIPIDSEMLDSIFSVLLSRPSDWHDVRDRLRSLGMNIYEQQTKIGTHSWMGAKNYMIGALMGQPSEDRFDETVASKLASFIIREIKHGMLCQKSSNNRTAVSAL